MPGHSADQNFEPGDVAATGGAGQHCRANFPQILPARQVYILKKSPGSGSAEEKNRIRIRP